MNILRIARASVSGPHRLTLEFSDGTCGEADLLRLLSGPVFEPLHDPVYFSQVSLDPMCGTVSWPNGADFAPEALRDLMLADSVVGVPAGVDV